MSGPPDRWTIQPLGELAEFAMGQAPPSADTNIDARGVPFYRSGEFGPRRPHTRIWTTKPLRRATSADVLVCVVGANAGDINLGADGAIGRSVAAITPSDDLDQTYLFHLLRLRTDQLRRSSQGSAQGVITKADLRRVEVPLPPIDEQRRIVDILEDHLSRLDAARAALDTAARRLQAWEAAILGECYASADRVPLASVTEIQGGIQKQPKRAPRKNAYPFLRVANVTASGLDLNEVHKIELFDGELGRLALRTGDLLVVEGNGSPSQIGRAVMWDGSIAECVHQNHLIRVRAVAPLQPEFLEAVWNAPQNRELLTRISSSSSGLHTLSVAKLKTLDIPLPSRDVQAALCARVSETRRARGRLDAKLSAERRRCDSLRRSILQAAFSGRLTAPSSDLARVAESIG